MFAAIDKLSIFPKELVNVIANYTTDTIEHIPNMVIDYKSYRAVLVNNVLYLHNQNTIYDENANILHIIHTII